MASIVFDDAYNRDGENNVEPNTIGADFYFLFGFITDDMYMDFPMIAQEFVSRCGKDLAKFNDVGWYDEAYVGINNPLKTVYSDIPAKLERWTNNSSFLEKSFTTQIRM